MNERRECIADARGFTLIELVVVMALIGIMLFMAIPSFQHLLTDDTRKASQWILLQVPKLKAKALTDRSPYTLHLDMDDHLLWVSSGFMSDEEMEFSREQGYALSEDSYLMDVTYPNGDTVDSGEAIINFYPKGYSDPAIIHIEDDDGVRRSFLIEPFLKWVEMREEYVDYSA